MGKGHRRPLHARADCRRAYPPDRERSRFEPERRRSTGTLLRTAARLVGTPPELLPFDTALLEKLAKVAPKRHRISKGHLFNVRGAVRFGLAYQGIEFVRGRDLSPPSAAWKALLDRLVDNPEKSTLMRAARWLTRQGSEPAAITLADIEAFRAALVAGDVRGAAKATWWRLVNGWVKALVTVPGWPAVEIPVKRWQNRWTTRLETCPNPCRRDRGRARLGSGRRSPCRSGRSIRHRS